jgi:hypothetical protein
MDTKHGSGYTIPKVALALVLICLVAVAGWYLYLHLYSPGANYPATSQNGSQILTGVVTLGPTAPVCRAGQTCTAPVSNHIIEALDTNGQIADSTKTDGSGYYTLHLKPGHYTLELSPPIGMGRTHDQVDIKDGTNNLDLTLDTGIR